MKKNLCLLLTTVMLFSCLSISVAAKSILQSGDAEIPYITETKELSERLADISICDEYTTTQKQLAIEKLETKLRESNAISIASAGSSDYSYTLDVPYQYQSENYFCGPATTRQTLLFFNVSDVPDQYQIAKDLKVTKDLGVPDAGFMIDYINAYIPDEPPYAEEHPMDMDDMILSFKVACKSYGPPILRIKANSTSNWPYPTGGHYLNVSGAYKSGSYYSFQLTDPYLGWVTSTTTGTHIASAEDVYSVVMLHWFGGYWW